MPACAGTGYAWFLAMTGSDPAGLLFAFCPLPFHFFPLPLAFLLRTVGGGSLATAFLLSGSPFVGALDPEDAFVDGGAVGGLREVVDVVRVGAIAQVPGEVVDAVAVDVVADQSFG